MDAQATYGQIVDDLAARHDDVKHGKMFGMPAVMAAGKAIAGLFKDQMIFKLPEADARAQALALEGAHLFEPMEGRQMKEWVAVPVAQAAEWTPLLETALKESGSG
jgi:hypothetical protein